MMFVFAMVLVIVLLSAIGNLMEQGMQPGDCTVHKWTTNSHPKRGHYLICSECGKEPL